MRPRTAGFFRPARLGAAILGGVLLVAGNGLADKLPPDPVEELRQALRAQGETHDLGARVAALRTLGEMRRALSAEWTVATEKSEDLLKNRFVEATRATLRTGDVSSKLAAITMLGEMGISGAGVDRGTVVARAFVKELTEIVARAEPRTSAAAAHALAKLGPRVKTELRDAVNALGKLQKAPAHSQRLAAAESLIEVLQVLNRASASANKLVVVDSGDLARAGQIVIPVAVQGLTDSDPLIRRRNMEAIHVASTFLTRSIGPRAAEITITQERLDQERIENAPVVSALVEAAPVLARALGDSDAEVRHLAGRTLENMGTAREVLTRPLAPAPRVPAKEEKTDTERGTEGPSIGTEEKDGLELAALRETLAQAAGQDTLLPGLRAALPALVKAVHDSDERVRLTAMDVLETLGSEAASAVPALSEALEAKSRFVRWAAARTLGKIGPVGKIASAVPGLTRLLEDPDLDVRLTAAGSLERLGPVAAMAVPSLTKSVGSSDAVLRIAAIRAVVGIGTDAVPALPAVASTLADADPRVRKTAAEALGRFGPAARSAVEALTKALDDADGDVRKAASDALLSVTDGGK